MDLYHQAEFPEDSNFLIVDKLIHGCANRECKLKLMAKDQDVAIKDYLKNLWQFEADDATVKKVSSETYVDTSYTRDPTKKSLQNLSTCQWLLTCAKP